MNSLHTRPSLKALKLSLAALVWACCGSVLRADISISPPLSSPPESHNCPVPQGQYDLCITTLIPLTRATQDPTIPTRLNRTGWTFVNAPKADFPDVTINVRMYRPRLCNPIDPSVAYIPGDVSPPRLTNVHCTHGAELEMALLLEPALGLNESWRWLQVGHDYGTFCLIPRGQWYLDNAPDDRTVPFYWSQASTNTFTSTPWNRPATWFFDAPEDGCWFNTQGCGTDCPRPDHWSAQFDTYLTKFNSATNTVTIYEGVHWGFQADCVPEPGTVALILIGLGFLNWRIRVHH